ncbi:MAG: lipopolysaccharide assembly protein LapA domain-containing protein [Candidatus Fermentibacterota bacterium]
MKGFKLVLVLLLAVILITAVLQNMQTVTASFLWMRAEMPAALLLLLTAVVGFAAGLLVALLPRDAARSKPKQEGSEIT